MHFTVFILPILSISVCCVFCYSFNTNDVIVISEKSVKNTYFSYTLLLQSGETVSSLIVGAPRNNNNPQSGGDIYKCDIGVGGETSCVQYPAGRTISSSSINENFFGMSLDGEDHVNGALVACAPRTVTSRYINSLRGYCIYMKNTSQVNGQLSEIKPLNNSAWYPDSQCCDSAKRPYYNFAFAMAGFDVSFYSEKNREVLLGAPGVKKFNGATVSYSIDEHGVSLLPTRIKPVQIDEDTYFGYSVTTAKFKHHDNETWFVAGAPRSKNLTGKVTIYFYDVTAKEKMNVAASFNGDEVGSYFGASVLALDVTNDNKIDILIGAPMAAGKTWDEGSVYFYKGLTEKSFLPKINLTGSGKIGSRFGSAIVSLGDFDLDSFNDVAVSAPYEDNGRGAVYIYKGSVEGLTDPYSQRISPEDFTGHSVTVKGFGMGISRGNDIDGNGHNDIAIGAYKSDQVFIIKTYSIIDYQFRLTPSKSTITNTTLLDLHFCLLYTKRSDKHILPQVKFNLSFDLDYRSVEGDKVDHINVDLAKTMCKIYSIQIRNIMTDISPFQIYLEIDTETKNIIAQGDRSLKIQIPYSHGCGNDDICDTDLSIKLITESQNIVLGLDKQIDVTVKVDNYGEPAYECKVIIEVPDGIELRNTKGCTLHSKNYTCLIDERLTGFQEKKFVFDIKDINPDVSAIKIAAEVTSLGRNKEGYQDNANINIPVVLHNTPYLVGKSEPENMELEIKNNMRDVEVVHQFSVGNTGPSPLELNVDILLPVVEHDEENIFQILEIKGSINNIQIFCTPTEIEDQVDFNELDDLKVPLNRTVVVSCNTENCIRYTCQGEYLYNSEQVAIFEVRMVMKSNLLVSKYKSELRTKDLIALIPIVFQNSPTERIGATSLLLIFVHGVRVVPLWVYLIAPAAGVILLMLISFCLYRCHFFDRVYKDKLDQEKILGSNDDGSVEDEIFDDVVFRPVEEIKQQEFL